jgi:hypothetical protein
MQVSREVRSRLGPPRRGAPSTGGGRARPRQRDHGEEVRQVHQQERLRGRRKGGQSQNFCAGQIFITYMYMEEIHVLQNFNFNESFPNL